MSVIDVSSWTDLNNIRNQLGSNRRLTRSLLTTDGDYLTFNDPATAGWLPIGDSLNPFTGTFDGQGFTIEGLYIDRPATHDIGLFGFQGGGIIQNIGVVDVDVSGKEYVGGLVGYNYNGTVSNSYATGNVSGDSLVGGLVGLNLYGTVNNSYATGNVATGNVSGTEWGVGGLMGVNYYGTVNNSYATGNVSGSDGVGGLVGYNDGTVSNSYASGDVSGLWCVGGLVGLNEGTVNNSYATGNVSGTDGCVGGLVGVNSLGTVSNSYATGTVTRLSGTDTDFGGFAGLNYQGKIINCYSTGSVHYDGATDPTDKGFVGGVNTGGDYEMTGNFWDTETSGQTTTAGDAIGKTTAEMMDITTFATAGWSISDVVGTPSYPYHNTNVWLIDQMPAFGDVIDTDADNAILSDSAELQTRGDL